MLASILPGVRELRAPLAAGYLWFLVAWMAFGEALPDGKEVREPLSRVYALEPLLSTIGVAAVASVSAYIVGSLAIDAHVGIRRYFRRRDIRPFAPHQHAVPLGLDGERRLLDMLPAGSDEDDLRRTARLFLAWGHIDDIRDLLKTRILIASEPLHSEIDRPDAEATLRSALWPPLTALAILFAVSGGPWWLLGLVVPFLVATQARARSEQANDALLVAITVDPALEKFIRDSLERDDDLQERLRLVETRLTTAA